MEIIEPNKYSDQASSNANNAGQATTGKVTEDLSQYSETALVDYDIVQRAAAGEEKAYTELLSRYRNPIYYMLLKMVGNKDDADDLTIEAFSKAFNSIKNFQPNYAFSTWLFRIASNNGIDFLRRKRKTVETVEVPDASQESAHPQADELNPADKIIKEQTTDLVREVVRKLKPTYRTLVEMRYFQELSYEEIAEKLNLPLGTVKAQLFRSRELLYNIFKNTGATKEL